MSTYPSRKGVPLRIYENQRPAPSGLILEDYLEDEEIGLLKTGKEAEVYLIERRARDRSCLLAEKRYRPAAERAFKNDIAYRSHRRLDGIVRDGDRLRRATKTRALQLAMDKKTAFGRKALAGMWIDAEWSMLQRLYQAGASVPYPVAMLDEGILMEFVGDRDGAAPRLAQARVERRDLPGLFDQVRENLFTFARAGVVHADLSPYNVLLRDGRIVVIDLPQAVPSLENLEATDFLHRDVHNICAWFVRKGMDLDPEDVFVEVLSVSFEYQMEDSFYAH